MRDIMPSDSGSENKLPLEMPNDTESENKPSPEALLFFSLYNQYVINNQKQPISLGNLTDERIKEWEAKNYILNRKLEQEEEKSLFIKKQLHYNLEKIKKIKAEEKKKELQKNNYILNKFKNIDDPVDNKIKKSKSGTSYLKIIQYYLNLASIIVKPITLFFSAISDIWSFVKPYLDEERVARKTSMGAATIRFARSVTAGILLGIGISNIFTAITFYLIGTLASLYRDSYIAYQNIQTIKKQKITIKEEENLLEQYQRMGFSSEIQEHQKAIIQKENEQLNKLYEYDLKNKIKVSIDLMNTLGTGLVIAGLFFHPLLLPGLFFIAASTTLKAIDKHYDDGLSRAFVWLKNSFSQARSWLGNSKKITPQVSASKKNSFSQQPAPKQQNKKAEKKSQHQVLSPLLIPHSQNSAVSSPSSNSTPERKTPPSPASRFSSESSLESTPSPLSRGSSQGSFRLLFDSQSPASSVSPILSTERPISPISHFPPISSLPAQGVFFASNNSKSDTSTSQGKESYLKKVAEIHSKSNEEFHKRSDSQQIDGDNECFASRRRRLQKV
jgi:hypothetical protein